MSVCCEKCGFQLVPYDRSHECISVLKAHIVKLEEHIIKLEDEQFEKYLEEVKQFEDASLEAAKDIVVG